MIDFTNKYPVTPKERTLIGSIVKRAIHEPQTVLPKSRTDILIAELELTAALAAAHANIEALDLNSMLAAPLEDLMHDVVRIQRHISSDGTKFVSPIGLKFSMRRAPLRYVLAADVAGPEKRSIERQRTGPMTLDEARKAVMDMFPGSDVSCGRKTASPQVVKVYLAQTPYGEGRVSSGFIFSIDKAADEPEDATDVAECYLCGKTRSRADLACFEDSKGFHEACMDCIAEQEEEDRICRGEMAKDPADYQE